MFGADVKTILDIADLIVRLWLDQCVVASGEIELESVNGVRRSFARGDTLWLCELPLRALHNRGSESVVLVTVSRRPADDEFSAAPRS